jgi:hypothetical protein
VSLLSMCGAGGGYRGGYATSYGSRAGEYHAGGVAAGWDTFVVVFTTEARYDSAGVSLFALPATPDTADTRRIYRLNDILAGRAPGGWAGSPADTVHRLGTGQKVSRFAWGNIDYADTNGYKPPSGLSVQLWSLGAANYSGSTFIDLGVPQTSRKLELFYIPWEKYIPANSTVVSARMNVSMTATTNMSQVDSIICVLMDNENDDKWYQVKGGTGLTTAPNYAHASWSHQEDVNGGTWAGTERYAWSPSLYNRAKAWDWGHISDWTGNVNATVQGKAPFWVEMTNCVQAAVAGRTNNGIMLGYYEGGTENAPAHYQWDGFSSVTNRTPVVVVKYITKRYTPRFGTADWAVVFQSDDGRYRANKAWTDTLATYGGKMTLYVAETQLKNSSALDSLRAFSVNELIALHDAGHEIGSHSRWHIGSVNYHSRINKGLTTGTGVGSTAYDSLVVDTSPNWLYAMADSMGRDLDGSLLWAKSYGAPTSQIGPYSQRALIDHEYLSYRGLAFGLTYDREKYYAPGVGAPAYGRDSLITVGPTQYARHAMNARQLMPHMGHIQFVGGPDSLSTSLTHMPKVKSAFERTVFSHIGRNQLVVSFFAHDLKTMGSEQYAAEGIQADEIGLIARVVRQWGGKWMTATELANWLMASGSAVDHPFNSQRTDTFAVYEADRAWFKPHGVDNRWIRGVR